MTANETACKDRNMALAILRTIAEGMKSGTQKAALESVAEWLRGNTVLEDITRMTPAERQARINEILTKERDLMTDKQRKAMAAFYLEGIKTKPKAPEGLDAAPALIKKGGYAGRT